MEVNFSAVSSVWAELKDVNHPKAWMVMKIKPETKNELIVVDHGRCGLERVIPTLTEDDIYFVAMRIYAVADNTKYHMLFFFTYTGPRTPFKTKITANQLKTSVLSHFAGVSATAEYDSIDDITEDDIKARLDSARGGRKPDSYIFGTGNPEDEDDSERAARLAEEERQRQEAARLEAIRLEKERLEREEAERLAAEEAARLEAIRLEEEEKQRKLDALPSFQKSVIKRLISEPNINGFDFSELVDAWVIEQLGDVDSPLAWVVAHLPEDAPKKVRILGSGTGGVDEFLSLLADDDICYGAFRATAVERRGKVMSLRARIVNFTWVGSDISLKTRSRNAEAPHAMAKYFVGPTLELKVNGDFSELEPESILNQLTKISGVTEHKFGHYERLAQAEEYLAQVAASDEVADRILTASDELRDAIQSGELKATRTEAPKSYIPRFDSSPAQTPTSSPMATTVVRGDATAAVADITEGVGDVHIDK